jgi:hypothetical protein
MNRYFAIPVIVIFYKNRETPEEMLGEWVTSVGDCLNKFQKKSYIISYIIGEIESRLENTHTNILSKRVNRISDFNLRVLEISKEPIIESNENSRNYTDEECIYISKQPQDLNDFLDCEKSSSSMVTEEYDPKKTNIIVKLCCKGMFVNERMISYIINCLNDFSEETHPLSSEEQIFTLHLAEGWMIK